MSEADAMRVLWFTEWRPPAVRQQLGMSSHPGPQAWVDSLCAALVASGGISLTIASPGPAAHAPFDAEGVRYYHIPVPTPQSRVVRIARGWRHALTPAATLTAAGDLVRELRPDVVHVHGTEGALGLISPIIAPTPCVISLQGILRAYEQSYFAGRRPAEVAALFLDPGFLKGRGVIHRYLLLRRQVEREAQIMRRGRWFIGRTEWDRAMLGSVNPAAQYYHCDEVMRDEFYSADWSRREHQGATLYSTSSGLMGKGTECLIEAVAILARRGVAGVRARIAGVQAGSEIDRIYRRAARRFGVADRIDWLGRLGAARIVDELEAADLFVYPTHVDNSPNALVEAMLAGTPTVASAVGGVPTLMGHGREGLLVSRGDAGALATGIAVLLDDRGKASLLGAAAREVARARNDPRQVATRTKEIYADLKSKGLVEDESGRVDGAVA
jgi:glycosyltransferase involved in cell wall biosynthesis